MADIIDQRVIKFCNEQVRPAAEKIRELDYLLEDIKRKWDNEISFIISENEITDTIADGRISQGVSVLTKNDLLLVLTQINTINTQMLGSGVRGVINKPCVRGLELR